MGPVLAAIIIIGGLGLLFGLGLAIGSRFLAVSVDPRLEKISELLPQLNCGACGYGGCDDCARAMLEGEAEPTVCPVADSETHRKIAGILGRMLKEEKKKTARIFCQGGYDAARRYEYEGVNTCAAANQIGGGVSACDYGCLRYYTCRDICPFGAIEVDERGNPFVVPEKCRTCGLCVANCPRGIIRLVPREARFDVICSSRAPAREVTKVCDEGCIGCGRCVKECPVDAIKIVENLARIDYEICVGCGKCAEVCPRNTIRGEI